MEKASASWAGELSRTRTEFAALKRRLSAVVVALGAQQQQHAIAGGNEETRANQPMPDPVRLLERISALEASMGQLEVDCQGVCANKRQTLAKETADALLRNARLIQELSARTGCEIGDGSIDGESGGDIGNDRYWTEDLAELAKQRDALRMSTSASSSEDEGAAGTEANASAR